MKKAIIVLAALILSFVIFSNCGEDKEELKMSDAQKTSAKNVVSNVTTLKTLKTDPKNQDVFAKLSAIQGDATNLIAAAEGSGQNTGKLTAALLQVNENCITATDTKVTYNCSAADFGGLYAISGTVTFSGDTYEIDLKMDMQSTGTTVSLIYKGKVTIPDTKIDGNLEYSYKTEVSGGEGIPGGMASATYNLKIKYDNIALDSAGCPTGGKTNIEYDVSAQGQSQKGSVELEYGPKCGDVKMYK
ncbi:MAG: hypothetical protein N3B13_08375 [Deltaproteobacteria bacterium]|nr:hypothetical protein [Deltaproteobacteria bacterium]